MEGDANSALPQPCGDTGARCRGSHASVMCLSDAFEELFSAGMPQPRCPSLCRYSRAAQCYEEAGRGQAAAEALSKGARAVEESDPRVRSNL